MLKRIVGVGALFAVLWGCGEPSGQVSPSGTNWVVTFDKQFQNEAKQPLVRAAAVCHNQTGWHYSTWANVNSQIGNTVLVVYCPYGVLAGSWESKAS